MYKIEISYNTLPLYKCIVNDFSGPQKPVITSISDIQSTSLNVSWSLGDPRPGTVTYTITLTPDQGAETKSYSVQGRSFMYHILILFMCYPCLLMVKSVMKYYLFFWVLLFFLRE